MRVPTIAGRVAAALLWSAAGFGAMRLEAQATSGDITGRVRDSAGTGVVAAEVVLAGSALRTLTDENGSFRLERVPAREWTVRVRRLGFHPESVAVTVAGGTSAHVDLALVPLPAQLATVQVAAPRQAFDSRLAGFHRRLEGGVGHFITRERLERVHSHRLMDVLREVPGARVGRLRGSSTIRFRGASCDPLFFVDGFPAAAGAVDLDMFDLGLVEAIEVYSGLATIPPEFISVRGQERCGVVAIWTRPFRPRRRAAASRPASADLERLVAEREVYTADQVESPARFEDGTVHPVYPDSLLRARITGRVTVEMVIDEEGRMVPGTLRVVSSTHPQFATAVRQALEEARFRAAMHQGRTVRQLIHLPFEFRAPPAGGTPPA